MQVHDRAGSPHPTGRAGQLPRAIVLGGLTAVAIVVIAIAAATGRSGGAATSDAPAPTVSAAPPVVTAVPVARDPEPEPALSVSAPELAATEPPPRDSEPEPATTQPATTTPTTAPAPAAPDDEAPSLEGTQPGLQAAFEAAGVALANDGIELIVNSGYRTVEHQLRLLDEAIVEYGSREEATRWVFEPERSMHVQGLAVDIGSGPAADWLQQHGARFGICQTLDWEWWHFEWRQAWQDRAACPRPASDPTDAPGINVG